LSESRFILESQTIGNTTKVTIICTKTLKEATIIVPKNISPSQIEKLAIQKLQYVINKNNI